MVSPRDKVYNPELIVSDLKTHPHTYATILEDEEVYNATMQFILRRKLNKLCKDGIIFKTTIPGTRFGQVILYVEPKPYTVVVESSRLGSNVYYFITYEELDEFHFRVLEYWKLQNTKWIQQNEPKIFKQGSILKMI